MRRQLPSSVSGTNFIAAARRHWKLAAIMCGLVALVVAGISYKRHADELAAEAADEAEEARWATPSDTGQSRSGGERGSVGKGREVNATWYDVPAESLAKRRGGPNELTAAHNRLPIGTLVRVTHLKNGKAVTVRITDRGIHDRRVKLDVCKEAAEELGMVRKGVARVRMEVLSEDRAGSPPEPQTAATQP